MSTPSTLIPSQVQDHLLAFCEERVINPVLPVRLPIQCRSLDVDVRIRRIKVRIPNDGCLARDRTRYIHRFEVRWRYQIDVLSWVGEESHHGESHKTSHRSRVIVPGETAPCWLEELGYVIVATIGGKTRSSGVVVLIDCQKGRLVSNICDVLIM